MKKVLPTLVILILIGVLGTIFYKTYYVKYSYSAEKADVNAYYGVQSEDDYPVVLQDQLSDYHARKMGDHFYLDLAPETRVYAQEGSSTWKDTSGNETTEDYEICVQNGEILYVALDFVSKYSNFYYETFSAPNRLRLYTEWGERQEATVTRDTSLRVSGGVKSAIVSEVPSGTRVVILDKMDTWCKVETEDAMIGYIENRKMTDSETVMMNPVTTYTEPEYKRTALDGKVNMAWHMIAGAGGNVTLADRIDSTKSVNVIAPTCLWTPARRRIMWMARTREACRSGRSLIISTGPMACSRNSSHPENPEVR